MFSYHYIFYQVICTGSSLHWPGIESGCFGIVSAPGNMDHLQPAVQTTRLSMVESVMRTHKVITCKDVTKDSRYLPALDGVCAAGTPVLVAPVRGRGGAVVGVLMVARGQNASEFAPDDVAALEISSTFGALSLYWCQGLGALHNKLDRSANKMKQLEKSIATLKDSAK